MSSFPTLSEHVQIGSRSMYIPQRPNFKATEYTEEQGKERERETRRLSPQSVASFSNGTSPA